MTTDVFDDDIAYWERVIRETRERLAAAVARGDTESEVDYGDELRICDVALRRARERPRRRLRRPSARHRI